MNDRKTRWRRAGHFFTVIAMAMTSWAGWHLGGDSLYASVVTALLFGGLTWAAAHLLTEIDTFWSEGRRAAAGGLAIVFGLFFVGEYFAHTMFNVSHRAADIQQASLQDIRFDDTQEQKAELAEKQKLLKARLAKLEGAAGWVSTKPSAAWKAEIANMEGDKLFARSRQCSSVTKADSRSFCDKLTELRANLAVAEDHDSTVAMLKATETALLTTREKSAEMRKGESIAADSTKVITQISTLSLAPSAASMAWTSIGIGGFVSLLSSIAAAVSNWLGSGVQSFGAAARRVKEAVVDANPLQPQIDELKAMLVRMAQSHQPSVHEVAAPVKTPATDTQAPVEKHTREVVMLERNDPRFDGLLKELGKWSDDAVRMKAAA